MNHWILLISFLIIAFPVEGKSRGTETVEELEKTIKKGFCSNSSETEAKHSCQEWLTKQKATLKDRVLISWCSTKQSLDKEKCPHNIEGEISYILRKVTREFRKT